MIVRNILIVFIATVLGLSGFAYVWSEIETFYRGTPKPDDISVPVSLLEPAPSPTSAPLSPTNPSPLSTRPPASQPQSPSPTPVSSEAALTSSGIIQLTNAERSSRGLTPLKENKLLTNAAKVKAQDMIENQYFSHESPSGVDVSELITATGYQYLSIAENIAVGNFKNNEAIVKAWMDSPGHRANILDPEYSEIGVSAIQGKWQGRIVWMAVQEFGRPRSACPMPDQAVKNAIENNQLQISALVQTINSKRATLDTLSPSSPGYNNAVKEYNDALAEYHDLFDSANILITDYTVQVNAYNACVTGA